MRALLSFTTIAAACLLTTSLAAQSLPGSGSMGGIGDKRRAPPDPVVLEGPPATDDIVAMLSLNDGQRVHYDSLYQRLMEKTRADREAINTAIARGGLSKENDMTPTMRGVMARLDGMQRAFDEALHEFLNKSQWKAYQKWRQDRRDQAVP